MTEPKKERAKTLQGMSRVLRHNGYAIITIPKDYMDAGNEKRFEEVSGEYGFTVKQHLKEEGPSRMDVYVLQKTHEPFSSRAYSLRWKGDPGGNR
ncbi:MAG: hypothetical protein QT01_C0008G0005 [archaeon GW2011_AR6]|nr:MAG: hypothetical protein QT01_C0008G0005 [archaeon GW2011_AR6]